MSRVDLLALTPEALVRLSNAGLVKRAQKELAAGVLPAIAEDADGTVVASASDGATTRLGRGVALQQTHCTCGSTQVCRHRIAAVLAYQHRNATTPVHELVDPTWDPGTLGDEALLSCCGAQVVARAAALLARGAVATTRPGARDTTGQPMPPSVVLGTATVQFLVPHDLAYAKCDCVRGQACEHVVLAVQAFRAAPAGGTVNLGGELQQPHTDPVSLGSPIDAALEFLVQYGLAAPGAPAVLERARGAAERAGSWWIVDGLESVERLAEAYHAQSARFQLSELAREVGELATRMRAADAKDPPLPRSFVLGSDRIGETAMEQVRLLSLGARLDADGDRRMVRLYFADPDTATVLVLDKSWNDERRVGADLGALFASSRMSITDLSRGELVTRAARRRANGALDLGAARGMKSSLLPSNIGATGPWSRLPEPLLVRDLAAHAARRRAMPPACLCPRGRGASVAVVQIGRVVSVDRLADGQSVTGWVEDTAGHRLILHTDHRRVAPGAVDASAAALGAGPSHVAGELRLTAEGWRMAPLSLLTTELVVVDLQRAAAHQGPMRLDAGGEPRPTAASPAARLAASTGDYVGRTLLKGARATGSLAASLAGEAERHFAHRLAARFARAAHGASSAVLDLAVLHQLDDVVG
ncbi:MAG: hypothetical protein IPJ34_42665 [Myxococcales bacterium]|nr:hypothetical protein [Myxococcales bacterium]